MQNAVVKRPGNAARLMELGATKTKFGMGEIVSREGEAPEYAGVLIEGVALALHTSPDCPEQVLSIKIPGDFLDPKSCFLNRTTSTFRAVTPLCVLRLPMKALRHRLTASPDTGLWIAQQVSQELAILERWVMGMGRKLCRDQMAHFFCEYWTRMSISGLVRGGACPFPLKQSDLASILGVSPVHINRTLQELRGLGLIKLRRSELAIVDMEALVELAMFDGRYLSSLTDLDFATADWRDGIDADEQRQTA